MTKSEDPPASWRVVAQPSDDGPRWAVYGPGQSKPLVWGLRSREAAVRWSWRMAGKDAQPTPAIGRSREPWWELKD